MGWNYFGKRAKTVEQPENDLFTAAAGNTG
jgi:hypothetical protein